MCSPTSDTLLTASSCCSRLSFMSSFAPVGAPPVGGLFVSGSCLVSGSVSGSRLVSGSRTGHLLAVWSPPLSSGPSPTAFCVLVLDPPLGLLPHPPTSASPADPPPVRSGGRVTDLDRSEPLSRVPPAA